MPAVYQGTLFRGQGPPRLDLARIGERIRTERVRRRLSLMTLEARTGVSRSLLSEVERGGKAPTVTVRIRQGWSVTAAAARTAPPGTIFLDGAAQGEPFIDPKHEVYNLDHHQGCVRQACQQRCGPSPGLLGRGGRGAVLGHECGRLAPMPGSTCPRSR